MFVDFVENITDNLDPEGLDMLLYDNNKKEIYFNPIYYDNYKYNNNFYNSNITQCQIQSLNKMGKCHKNYNQKQNFFENKIMDNDYEDCMDYKYCTQINFYKKKDYDNDYKYSKNIKDSFKMNNKFNSYKKQQYNKNNYYYNDEYDNFK